MKKVFFINDNKNFPSTLCVMFDHESNYPIDYIDLKKGKKIITNKPIKFNVEQNKFATSEYLETWDFIPNSIRIPLVNIKVVKLLEEISSTEFQVIPTQINLPNNESIKDYFLLNILKMVDDSIVEEKSKLKLNPIGEWDKFILSAIDAKAFKDCHLALTGNFNFICSDELKKNIHKHKLRGVVFEDRSVGEFLVY